MRCTLRYLHTPDAPDLERFQPPDPAHFGILVQAMIGPEDESRGEESFDFVACTSSWLAEQSKGGKHRWGHGYLLLDAYDYSTLERAVSRLCATATCESWLEIAGRLARYTLWESDDYREP